MPHLSKTSAIKLISYATQLRNITIYCCRQIKFLLTGRSELLIEEMLTKDVQKKNTPPTDKQFRKCFYPNDYTEVEKLAQAWASSPSIKASIIVASYNQKDTLLLNLIGWAQQTYPMHLFEIIVSDDGSRDGTDKLIAEIKNTLPYSLKFYTQEDKGFRLSKVRNEGVALSDGEVIFFVDADTIASPEYIWEHMKYYHVSDRVAVVGMRHRIAPDATDEATVKNNIESLRYLPMLEDQVASAETRYWRKNVLFNNVAFRKHYPVWGGFHGTLGSCRRQDYLGVGGNDESFVAYGQEDSEFAFRLMSKVQYLVSNPKALIFHIEHQDNPGKKDPINTKVFKRKTTNPTVSICIIVTEPIMEKSCVGIILSQQKKLPEDFELVIINTSFNPTFRDELEKIRYSPRIRIFNEPNRLKGAAYNQAFLYARGQFVVVVHPEDKSIDISRIRTFIDQKEQDKEIGFFYSGIYSLSQKKEHTATTRSKFIAGQMPSLPWIVGKSFFAQTEGFNLSLNEMAEYDMALKLEEVCHSVDMQNSIVHQTVFTAKQTGGVNFELMASIINQALKRRAIPLIAKVNLHSIRFC